MSHWFLPSWRRLTPADLPPVSLTPTMPVRAGLLADVDDPTAKPQPAPQPPPAAGITVTRRASGADLDVTPYARSFLRGLLALLAEHPEVWDDLDDIINGDTPDHDRHLPDVPSRDDVLVEQLLAALPTSIRVYGPEVERLGAQLAAITAQAAAVRQGRSAAA
jgi:hypothetical protein